MNWKLFCSIGLLILAQTSHAHSGHDHETASAELRNTEKEQEWTSGLVRKVDIGQKRITIKHGAIRNLGMEPMTMVFLVKEAKLLEGIQPDHKIRFKAAEVGGALYITDLQTQP